MSRTRRIATLDLARRTIVAAVAGAGIALLAMLLFGLAARAGLNRDLPQARANIGAAFETGALQQRDWVAGDTGIGHHQYNDCLILWQAIDQRGTARELAVSPLRHVPTGERSMCDGLRGLAAGEPPPPRDFYHRYVHGHTTLARYLLPAIGVEGMRILFRTASTLLVLAGVALSLVALARGRRPVEGLFWLIVFLSFSRWFGLESFGQSLGHGPADAVHLAFLLFLAAASFGGGLSRRTAILASGAFGALVAIFEFLTGGIPLGLAAVIGGVPFATARDRAPASFVWDALVAFCAGVLVCLGVKLLAALYMFGPSSFADTAAQLQLRAGLATGQGETAGVEIDLRFVAKKLLTGLGGLAAGMHVMAGATIALAVAAGAWGARRLLRGGDAGLRDRAVALLLSNAAIALMLGLLWQHTLIHAWFMERTLVWTIASGFALFALGVRVQPDREPGAANAR